MKYHFTLLFILFILISYGQTFNYKIRLQNVTTLPDAKYATDPMRDLFQTYPTFNDSIDHFEFISSILVNETDFIAYMNTKNYTTTFFSYEALKPKGRGEQKRKEQYSTFSQLYI